MADLIRMGAAGGGVMVMQRDKLGSPSTGSEDGGGGGGGGVIDLADLAPELDQDEFDGPATLNGESLFFYICCKLFLVQSNMCTLYIQCWCYQFCCKNIYYLDVTCNCVVAFYFLKNS